MTNPDFRPFVEVFSIILLVFYVGIKHVHAADYYWVGGAGDWSDITHWRTTSGGTVQHSSVPSSNDNVFFDANSFSATGQTIVVNNGNIFSASFNWTAATLNPRFVGTKDKTLNVSGDLILSANMQFAFDGNVVFNGSVPGRVNLAGHRIKGVLEINGSAMEGWTLDDALRVDSSIVINSGGFHTNGFNVRTGYFHIHASGQTSLSLGNSTIELNAAYDPSRRNYFEAEATLGINTDNVTLDPGTSTIQLTRPFSNVRIFGSKNIALNNVSFSNPKGIGLFNYHQYANQYQFFPVMDELVITINQLTFRNNGQLYSELKVNQVNLQPSKTYRFSSSKTKIVQTLNAPGLCSAPITMSSTNARTAATFQFNQGQNISYVNMRNIRATGVGAFVANDASDLGGNQGWTIAERDPGTLFWVGGDGNWSDPMHWATTSGGTPGACVPSPLDDVVFDQQSFVGNNTVTIDIEDALCHDMIWQDLVAAPVFSSTENERLNIYGSLRFDASQSLDLQGDVHFLSKDSQNRIDMAGHAFGQDVFFEGKGEWILDSDFETAEISYLIEGTLRLAGNDYITESFLSNSSELARVLDIEDSRMELRTLRRYGGSLNINSYDNQFELFAQNSIVEFNISGTTNLNGNESEVLDFDRIYFNSGGTLRSNYAQITANFVRYFGDGRLEGNLDLGKVFLSPGHDYQIFYQEQIGEGLLIDTLDAEGKCDGLISISTYYNDDVKTIQSSWNQTGSYLIVEDVHFAGGTFTADQSHDLGNTQGWVLDGPSGRDLYWVGGDGLWEDPAHWSLISGGPGGECIPTPRDDIYFDQNSFSAPDQLVRTENFQLATCHDMHWSGTLESNGIYRFGDYISSTIYVYGSINIEQAMRSEFPSFTMRGQEVHTIRTNSNWVDNYYFRGTGEWTLEDSLYTYSIWLEGGTFKTNDQYVESHRLGIEAYRTPTRLELANSYIRLRERGYNYYGTLYLGNPTFFSMDAGTSTIEFTDPQASITWQRDFSFHNIHFSATSGRAQMMRIGREEDRSGVVAINKLQIDNDGSIFGEHIIDSLLFGQGHAYQLESDKVQEVKEYFQIRGNNCIQLRLNASISGQPSIVEMASGQVDGDFIQMADQIARGGATFFAGANSTDISNNTGWIFDSEEEYVDDGLLGEDVVFCKGETSLVLNEEDLIGAVSYQWIDGSSDASLAVQNTGIYWVEATYANDCVLIDTIYILEESEFVLELPEDTTLCEGELLDLQVDLDLVGVDYEWSDGIQGADRVLDTAGLFSLVATLNGCPTKDSILLNYIEVPALDLSIDGGACQGDTVYLDGTVPGAAIEWSTGSTDPILAVTTSDTYSLTLTKDGCEASDSLEIFFEAPPVFELGEPQVICAGESISLDATVPEATYVWSTGDETAGISPNLYASQEITVSVSVGNCTRADTLSIAVNPLPTISGGEDQVICPQESTEISVQTNGTDILWNDLSTSSVRTIDRAGTYVVSSMLQECINYDTIQIDLYTTQFKSLPPDSLICDDDFYSVDIEIVNGSYMWNDGNTSGTRTLQDAGMYQVEVFDGNCSFRDTLVLQTRSCVYFQLYVPTAFSPNGDNQNDIFQPAINPLVQVQTYSFQIFDRWGSQVFSSNDISESWDGKTDGSAMKPDVYVYRVFMDYVDDNGPGTYQGGGDVMLIR